LRIVALVLLVASACAQAVRGDAPEATVILISLDGVRYDYPERAELPAFERVQREGVRAERLVPITPASTFPSHVALATGAPVERHGIVANRFLDPERGEFNYSNDASWIGAEPLWIAAERQGVRAAVFFWVGSETDWHGRRATHRQAPFDTRVSERAKVEQILAWLDLPRPQRPRLIMTWWHGADAAGHRLGPDAPEIAQAMRGQDRELARLLRGLDTRAAWPHTTLILVSDHGMVGVNESIDVARSLRRAKIGCQVRSSEGVAYVYLDAPERSADAVRILAAIPGVVVYPIDRLPRELHMAVPGRSGHVVAFTEPPRRLSARRPGPLGAFEGEPRGAHGYRGDRPEMGGIFYALGRGVPAGRRLGAVRALDVAATAAALLGIDPPQDSTGRPQF